MQDLFMQDGTKMNGRRGRPISYDREMAVRGMVETFQRSGFAATSLDELSAATKMNRPSLFTVFGNKKAMYFAALEAYRADMREAVGSSLESGGNLRDDLLAYFDAAISFYCAGPQKGCMVLCGATSEAASDPEVRQVLKSVLGDIENHLRDRVEIAIAEESKYVGLEAMQLAKLLAAVLVAVAVQARSGIPEAELKRLARFAVTAAVP